VVTETPPGAGPPFNVVGLGYVSLYVDDIRTAREFYARVFGEPEYEEDGSLLGWRMGRTWLTVFGGPDRPSDVPGPRNAEFAIEVAAASEVDALHEALTAAGARSLRSPRDTAMYERMRFAAVDDPLGMRIDVYCPIQPAAG
jgi:catechol 2,3-dioxygenase-like lactoylglutathione lyase family enzyme